MADVSITKLLVVVFLVVLVIAVYLIGKVIK